MHIIVEQAKTLNSFVMSQDFATGQLAARLKAAKIDSNIANFLPAERMHARAFVNGQVLVLNMLISGKMVATLSANLLAAEINYLVAEEGKYASAALKSLMNELASRLTENQAQRFGAIRYNAPIFMVKNLLAIGFTLAEKPSAETKRTQKIMLNYYIYQDEGHQER